MKREFARRLRRSSCGALVPIVAFVGLLFAGCQGLEDVDGNLDFTTGQQQDDIPVPKDFTFLPARSPSYIRYSSGVGAFRQWDGVYTGDQQERNLVPWYEKQMQLDGWKHKSTEIENDQRVLTFVKGTETAKIRIFRELDLHERRHVTVVHAGISPTPIDTLTPEEALNPDGADAPAQWDPKVTDSINVEPAVIRIPAGAKVRQSARPQSSARQVSGREGTTSARTSPLPDASVEDATATSSLKKKPIVKGGLGTENAASRPDRDAAPEESEAADSGLGDDDDVGGDE